MPSDPASEDARSASPVHGTGGARFLGHPLHPMLTAFPLAFWIGGTFWDLFALWRPELLWAQLAAWTVGAGVVTALPAMATGAWDLVRLPGDHPGERLAWWHGGSMAVAWCLFLVSLLLRRDVLAGGPAPDVPWLATVLSVTGVALTGLGGWLGGELVFGHGIGVQTDGGADTMASPEGG